jgi:hypothetical protein
MLSFSRLMVAGLAVVVPFLNVCRMLINAQGLFNESMVYMDRFYDSPADYLYGMSRASVLRHETRSSHGTLLACWRGALAMAVPRRRRSSPMLI